MKKYFGLLAGLFLLNACDDGDLTFESFDFADTVLPQSCGSSISDTSPVSATLNSVFRVQGNEAMIIKFPVTSFPFANFEEEETIALSATTQVIYRVYSDAVPTGFFCSTLAPTSPTVIDESIASSGTIRIKSKIIDGATTTGSAAKYVHTITFENITFVSSEGTVTYENLRFGDYQTDSNITFQFNGTGAGEQMQSCSNGKHFKIRDNNQDGSTYRQNINETLVLEIPYDQLPTTENTTVRRFINPANGISISYSIYGGDVTSASLCTGSPLLPQLYDTWNAEPGIMSDISDDEDTGYIEIETTMVNGNLNHKFTFRKVTFKNGEKTFSQALVNFGTYVSN